jgi:hypothetical protein
MPELEQTIQKTLAAHRPTVVGDATLACTCGDIFTEAGAFDMWFEQHLASELSKAVREQRNELALALRRLLSTIDEHIDTINAAIAALMAHSSQSELPTAPPSETPK